MRGVGVAVRAEGVGTGSDGTRNRADETSLSPSWSTADEVLISVLARTTGVLSKAMFSSAIVVAPSSSSGPALVPSMSFSSTSLSSLRLVINVSPSVTLISMASPCSVLIDFLIVFPSSSLVWQGCLCSAYSSSASELCWSWLDVVGVSVTAENGLRAR